MKQNKRAVSLIVLVITIVVIIILAAAVILTINNNNPMDNANKARYMSDRANVQNALSTAVGKIAADKMCSVIIPAQADIVSGIGYTLTGANDGITAGKIGWDTLATVSGDEEATTTLGMKIPNYGNDTRWFVNANGDIGVQIGNIAYGSGGVIDVLQEGTNNKAEAKWNKPYVPAGFHYVEGTVETGYVIQDSSGNEYVWIPVNLSSINYERDTSYSGQHQALVDVDGRKPELTCGGFYIGRYEAGKNDDKVVIKRGATVWTNITFAQAKIQAQVVKGNYHYTEGTTNLLTGTQWDTLMKWLGNKGFDVRNSSTWGNYNDPATLGPSAGVQTTGKNESWKAQNIYDLAGNAWEWTDEAAGLAFIARGGSYYGLGTEYSVSFRYSYLDTYANSDQGFRVALYF